MPACPRPACVRRAGAPAAVPRGRAAAASCGSRARPRATAAHAAGASRSDGAPPPVRAAATAPRHRRHDDAGSGSRSDPPRSPARPPLAHPMHADTGAPRLPAWRRASPFFCRDILQHGVVQHRLGQQLLQPTVLVLQRPQPLGLRHLQAAVLRLPLVERRAADPVLAADIRRRRSRLVLPQDPDDLLFREPRSSSSSVSPRRRTLPKSGGVSGAQVTSISGSLRTCGSSVGSGLAGPEVNSQARNAIARSSETEFERSTWTISFHLPARKPVSSSSSRAADSSGSRSNAPPPSGISQLY